MQPLGLVFNTHAHLLLPASNKCSSLSYLNAVYLWGALSAKPLMHLIKAQRVPCRVSSASQWSQTKPFTHQLFSRLFCLGKIFQKLHLLSLHIPHHFIALWSFQEGRNLVLYLLRHSLYSFQDTSEDGCWMGNAKPVAFQMMNFSHQLQVILYFYYKDSKHIF